MQREPTYPSNPQYRHYEGNRERSLVPNAVGMPEQARPVLGNQPPPPGTTPLRFSEAGEFEPNLEMVVSQPYFREEEPPLIDLGSEPMGIHPDQPIYTSRDVDQFLYYVNQGNRNFG